MINCNLKNKLSGVAAVVALTLPVAVIAQPTPSTWNVQNSFTPGGAHSLTMPWQTYQASGPNCSTIGAQLTTPWTQQAWTPLVSGVGTAAPTSAGHNLPAVFRNNLTSPVSYPPESLTIYPGQVALHPGDECAVLRFKAPVDGIYTIRGEFWSPTGSTHPSNVTARVLDKGVQVPGYSGSVSAGTANQWIIPNPTQQYQLQAGQTIDFAVDNGGNGYYSDTTLLSAEVKWVDNLPNTFKASNFDFEGSHGCAIEQGTNKLYCWGKASTSGLMLGNNSTVNQNKAVPATAVDAFLTTNSLGTVQNIQVGATNNCVRTAAATVCFGENGKGESGNPSSGSIIKDVTTQLGPYQGARLDGSTGCIITAAPNPNPGKMQCWGNNQINTPANGGLLGWKNGTSFTNSHLPLAPVPNVVDAKDVAPGGVMSCAVVGPQGKVICWSKNPWSDAILGGGYPTPSGDLLPNPDGIWQVYVKTAPGVDLTGAKRVSANGAHACAMTNAGQLYCWGLNTTIAAATGAPSPNPIWAWQLAHARLVGFPNGVTDFAINGSATCVVAGAAAQVFCQGHNTYGQIGDPNTGFNKLFTFGTYTPGVYGLQTVYSNLQSGTPKPIPNLTQIQKIRSGSGSEGFCALDANAAIWCWGRGDSGQLGNGASLSSHVPVKVIK